MLLVISVDFTVIFIFSTYKVNNVADLFYAEMLL